MEKKNCFRIMPSELDETDSEARNNSDGIRRRRVRTTRKGIRVPVLKKRK